MILGDSMVNKMIVSELLFFALNKLGSVPVDQLKRIINDFLLCWRHTSGERAVSR